MDAVKEYFDSIPETRRKCFGTLHGLIMELFPDAEITMSYKMPTYRLNTGWTAIANQKQYVSLYTCGAHHLESFKRIHPQIKTGKGCINFEDSDKIPIEALTSVIQSAMTDRSHQK